MRSRERCEGDAIAMDEVKGVLRSATPEGRQRCYRYGPELVAFYRSDRTAQSRKMSVFLD